MGKFLIFGATGSIGSVSSKLLSMVFNEIILCERNRQDIEEIDSRYVRGMKFTYANKMNEVVRRALLSTKVDSPLDFGIKESN